MCFMPYSLQQNIFNYTRFNKKKYFKVIWYFSRVQESLNLCFKFCKLKATNTNTQPLSGKIRQGDKLNSF